MMVTSCVTPSWCFSSCKRFTQPTLKLEQNEKTKVIHHVSYLDTALDWKSVKFALWPLVDTAVHGHVTLGVAGSPVAVLQTSSRTSSEPYMNAFSYVRTLRQNLPSSARVWV